MAKSKTKSTHTDGSSGEKISAKQKILSVLDEKDKIIKEQKKEIERLTDDSATEKLHVIRFVAIEFDRKHYKAGEDELNAYLEKGFKVIKDFQTASGLVMVLDNKNGNFEDGQ